LPYVLVLSGGVCASAWFGARAKVVSGASVLFISALLHMVALFALTAFEDDYFRFVWDGWRTLETGSPYGVAPAEFFGDASVPALYARVLDRINNPEYPTIYGPVLELIFALTSAVAGASTLAPRIVFTLLNLALAALLVKRAPARMAMLYAWSPFVLSEIAINAHPDAIVALFIALAWAAGKERPALAGLALALAAGAKIVALAAWPALLWLPMRARLCAVIGLVALYAPFVMQTSSAGFDSTAVFATGWLFNPLAFAGLDALLPSAGARLVSAAIGIGIILALDWRGRGFEATPLATIFAVIVLISPAANPWYLLWALPFVTHTRQIWPFAAAAALPLSYLTGLNLECETLAPYAVHPVAWGVELAIIGGAIGFDLWRAHRAKPRAQ
jgi:hypothetical protein